MVVKSWHIGDVIRKMRQQNWLTATTLARKAGLKRSVVLSLESRGPEVEGLTPQQWQALDRVAVVLGLSNGAAIFKLVPEAVDPARPADSFSPRVTGRRVLPFARRE